MAYQYQRLSHALEMLDKTTNEFPNGAIRIDDFMPVEDKIKSLRTMLKELNARVLYLKSVSRENKITEVPEEDLNATIDQLAGDIMSYSIINDNGVNLCLETHAIEEILSEQEDLESRETLEQVCQKLYLLNDNALRIRNEIKEMMTKLLYLKSKDQKEAHNYRNFLKDQEELRVQKLQHSNPIIAQYKQKIEKTIQKTNIMKKLILKFIAESRFLLTDEPYFLELLKKHRKILTLETISNMVQDQKNSSE